MDATQMISDSFLESDEEENEEENGNKRGQPLAKLCILKNEHIPEKELPLFLGENVLGRDPNTCTLPLLAPSVSKQHATICISVHGKRGCHSEEDTEALVWDLGSMNGTRKGRLKLTPNVRYALSESDSLVVADIPCQYVRCAADTACSQGGFRTPLSKKSRVKARLSDASGEKEVDTSTGSKKCVNGGTEASVSLPDREGTRETPVRTSCLSFEKTPTQPQGTLVPESDSDSEGERGGGADRRRKAQVSDSDSYKSSPTCSTFLSPTNKIVPESEDESPITPSVSTKNRPHRHVSFSTEETEVDVGRQQLKEKKALAIVDNSEEEEGEEEERAALGGRKSEESEQCLSVKQENNVSLTGEDKLPVSAPAVSTDAIPAFNMDSDTDVEGEEEEVVPAHPVTLSTNQNTDQPPNTAQFHMDSDTDVDEDDDALDKNIKSVLSSADDIEPPHVLTVNQPEAITMDSDTDVDDDDDDDAAVSDAASKAKPLSVQNTPTADSATSAQLEDFHLESDTDVDEEEEKECGTITISKIDESPTGLDSKPIWTKTAAAAPNSLHLDSDTDDEATPAPVISEPSVVSAVTELRTTAEAGANLDILCDSDTDVEDEAPLVIPFAITSLSFVPGATSEALQSDSDADTDVDDSSVPPAGDGVNPADVRVDSDTDVEDEEDDFGSAGDGQIPNLRRENTPGLMAPPLQNCSTPVQLTGPEGGVEDMDTQAFLSPSSAPFRRAALIPKALSSCSESQDEDLVVAETQSFILQTRDCQGNAPGDHTMEPTQAFGLESSGDEKVEQPSRGGSFQLGLSDSSHLQDRAQALAMESTQAFVSVEGDVNLEETQAYAAISNSDRTSSESDSNLEATQAYGEEEEAAKCSVMAEKKGQVDLALEATQAYVSEPYCDSEDETDEDKTKDSDTAETQLLDFPTASTLSMAETQPMSAFEEAKSVEEENPASSVLQVKQNEEREGHGEAAQPQERHLSEALSAAATQPMCASDDEESDDEDSIPGPRKRKAKPLELEDEQTQSLTSSETQPMHIGVAETQPMATSGNEESDEEDSIPGPRKRKAKQLHLEEEETQRFTNSELSAVETQPMDTGKVTESDDEDSIPVPRKRKAKALKLEEDQTQPLTFSDVSAVETQPVVTGEDEESDDEDSIPGLRKRKAKPLQIQDEETQSLTNSEASTVDTQPLETKTVPHPRRGKRGQSEAGGSGVTVRSRRGTRSGLREEEEQAECSEPPRRQTSRKNKVLPATRGRRGKQMPDDNKSEEGEKVERAKRARGKKSTKQQEDEEAEETEKETRERKRKDQEEKVRAKEEQLKRERKEKEEKERIERENAEKVEKERLERVEKVRIVKERNEQEEKERAERMQKEEQLERERKEKEEKERLEREKAEKEEKDRLEREEKARIVRERKEQEEKERAERMQKEEQLERERKEKEEKERLEREKAEKEEKERLDREEKVRMEKERKEQEEKDRLETVKKEQEERLERERKKQEHQARLESEAKERDERETSEREKKEKEAKEKQTEQQESVKTPARGRRAPRRTTAARSTTEPEQDSTISTNDDVPARRTRSRSNSSNSVSSERSASSVNTQGSRGRGRGRGRGAKRTSEPPRPAVARGSNRRRTVAAETTEQDSNNTSPQRALSRSNSNNSEISSCSLSSQSNARGGRQRGRGRKAEEDFIPLISSQSDQNSATKSTPRGRKSRKVEESSDTVPQEDYEKIDSQQATTTRGRRRANAKGSEPAAADEKTPSNQEEGLANEESPPPKKNVRGQKAVKSETVEASVAPAVSDGVEAKDQRKGRKRQLETDTEEDSHCGTQSPQGKEKAQTAEAKTKDEPKKRGRASSAQAKKNAKDPPTDLEMKEASEKMEGGMVERRGRGRPSAIQKKKTEEQEDSGTSVDPDAHVEASEPQTPTRSVSRKRQAPAVSSPLAKTPRSSCVSPAAGGRARAASQAYKVLFTGVVDEAGERVLARLGGSMAKGVADMNVLVTDKVRRTVKFLCAVAKGVPIVTTHWLEKSGKAGSFLSPNAFTVKDPEQEKKFNFCLQDSLRTASSQPLLQGYEIHVTKSVKPDPVQMKDIISCSGATFLPRMPSSHKPQTVVISCEEDWPLCGPALSASLPVVTAEFILTGILQQKVDFQIHSLSAPTSKLQSAGGRGKGRKKS